MTKELIFVGFEQAIFLFVCILTVFAYFTNKEKIYIYFFVYVFTHMLFFLAVHNVFGIYIFKDSYNLNYYFRIMHPIGSIAYGLFLLKALNIQKYAPIIHKYLIYPLVMLFFVFEVFFITMIFVNFSIHSQHISKINMIFGIFFIITIGIVFPKLRKHELIFAIGFYVFIIFAITRVYLSDYIFASYHLPFELGILLEIIIFTYALHFRTKQMIFEKKYIEDKNEFLSNKIRQSNKDLVASSYKILRKEAIYNSLSSKVSELQEDKDLLLGRLKKLVNSFDSENQTEMHWKEFDALFDTAHDGFLTWLTEQYPSLSTTELRLCCMLRMLMKTKEIAALTNKTERSIEVMRSRIRKKLDIPKDISLSVFLLKFKPGNFPDDFEKTMGSEFSGSIRNKPNYN